MQPKTLIPQREFKRLTTPRAAASAGIAFAVLFAASLALLRTSLPEVPSVGTDWIVQGGQRISLGIGLMPFAGIAFLWFVGVVRDRLGEFEDQLFSTVFYGSSLLFLAMVFVASAIAGGILAMARAINLSNLDLDVVYFGRSVMLQISNVYALRMASIFMTSLGTIWWRTGLMPRWLAIITLVIALVLLLISNLSLWVTLMFPAWVFLISIYILVQNVQRTE